MSKYFSESEIRQLVAETEAEIDARQAQRAEAETLEKVRQWAANPSNAAQLAHIRAEFNRVTPAQHQPQQSPATAAVAPVQRIGFSNHAIDPHVASPSARSRSSESVRYSPGAPSLPPGGFWVL